ncbi:MAG: hypothetical protein JWR65_4571 [Massilia sp.]|jgi:hypothetical protein|nr:hypothetical protein [Massilia sp.]
MTTDIAVFRGLAVLLRRSVSEDLEIGAVAAPNHLEALDLCARIDIQMHLHPIIVEFKGAQVEGGLAADHLDEEVHGIVHVGHRDAEMVCATHAGQAAGMGRLNGNRQERQQGGTASNFFIIIFVSVENRSLCDVVGDVDIAYPSQQETN